MHTCILMYIYTYMRNIYIYIRAHVCDMNLVTHYPPPYMCDEPPLHTYISYSMHADSHTKESYKRGKKTSILVVFIRMSLYLFNVHIHIYIYTSIHVHACTYIYIHIYIYIYIFIYMHIYTYIRIHTYICVYIYVTP